ncbi:unnamed protein product [Microthlaspi erraticum]|uniref:Dilute domain-containing protein n=1 Tax=Microthlaspi erraticum TaxID=1685480 RepID=A0A6D2KQA4_9BRAS|nr:unnamed protein product [Microthlaspi erraticum]
MLRRESEILTVTEAHRVAIEESPLAIRETPKMVEDTEKIISLTVEVEALKASLQSEGQATEDLRKALAVAESRNSELAAKLDQLQESMKRLHEKLSKSKLEIQVIQQQAKDTSLAVKEPESKDEANKYLEKEDLLVKCISQNLGYDEGKPVAACIIYRCLCYWRSFELENTSIFQRIVQTIASAIEVPNNNEVLAYWLSNSAALLVLLQHTLRAPEAKYPALRFKLQLTALVEKISEMIRDNLKKEISPLLASCIKGTISSLEKSVLERAKTVAEQDRIRKGLKVLKTYLHAAGQQALFANWQSIRKPLNTCLNIMKANNFFSVTKLCSLLLRRECCSFSYGKYVKAGLAELEQWCVEATDEYASSAWDELSHVRQAVDFLATREKPKMTLDEIARELCPVLSVKQIYRISTMYCDDQYGTPSVSSDVIANMRVMMREDSNNAESSSFLLDDDSSVPFTVGDLSKSMLLKQVDLSNIKPPQLIREHPDFSFLLIREEGSST